MTGSLSLAARAAYILRDNSTGLITKAAPTLYPHQWSWDAAFNAIGLATVDLPRARLELDSLFAGQWRNGMLPHIVFDPAADGYWPGPAQWECARLQRGRPGGARDERDHRPAGARDRGRPDPGGRRGRRAGAEAELTLGWAAHLYPKLLAWHRFLARDRADKADRADDAVPRLGVAARTTRPAGTCPYAEVEVGPGLPAYIRTDKAHVSDAGQRPTDREYDRYLWLVEEAKRGRLRRGPAARDPGRFQVGDVLFTAIFACASDLLAELAVRLRKPDDAAELKDYAAQARAAVFCHVDEASGLAADVDLRTGSWLRTETIAGLRPADRRRHAATCGSARSTLLTGPRWAGHPSLKCAAAAVDVAVLARVQPGVLLARTGVAGLHLAAHLGAVPVRRARGRRARCGRRRSSSSATRRSPSTTTR